MSCDGKIVPLIMHLITSWSQQVKLSSADDVEVI